MFRNEVLTVSQKLINGLKKSTNHGIDQSDTTTLLPCQGNDGVVEKKSMLGLEIYKRVFGPTLDLSRGGTLHIFAHFDNFYHGYIMGGHPELDVLPLLRRHAAILRSLNNDLGETLSKKHLKYLDRDINELQKKSGSIVHRYFPSHSSSDDRAAESENSVR